MTSTRGSLLREIADYISVSLISINPAYFISKKYSEREQLYFTSSIIIERSEKYFKTEDGAWKTLKAPVPHKIREGKR